MIDGNIDVVSLTGDITDSVSLEGELLPIGPKGDKGDPGFSPVVTTSKSGKTTTVKFETATGNVYAYIQDGEDGQGSGDMLTDVYDQNKNGIVDNAEKVNNHTVLTDVPANAVFTDTVYDDTEVRSLINAKPSFSDIPTKVSDLTNDSGFIDNTVNNLTNYYLKTETYTKTEINNLIAQIPGFNIEVVQTLPVSDIDPHTIYLVPKTGSTGDIYDEYLYINNSWELIGNTAVDLTNYVKKTDYATNSTGGVIKTDTSTYGTAMYSGYLTGSTKTYAQYGSSANALFVSKGTLENVITGKELVNKDVNNLTNYANVNESAQTTETNVSSATLTNTLEAPMDIDLKGNTLQNGTPTPSTPIPINNVSGDNDIKVEGENLFIPDVNSNAIDAYDNDTFSFKGNLGVSWYGYIGRLEAKANTTYTISSSNAFVYGRLGMNLRNDENCKTTNRPDTTIQWDASAKVIKPDTLTTTFTSNTNQTIYFWYCSDENNSNKQAFTTSIKINIGSTAKPYSPYTGTTYNIDLPVENLLDLSNTQTAQGLTSSYDSTTGKFSFSGTSNAGYCNLTVQTNCDIPSGTYTISLNHTFNKNMHLILNFEDSTSVDINIEANTTSKTFTTNKKAISQRIYTATTSNTTYNESFYIQLEKGSKVNSFTPYGTTPIELNKIGTYQDYIYKENDKWYLHKEIEKVVLDDDTQIELWAGAQSQNNTIAFRYQTTNMINIQENDSNIYQYCNCFNSNSRKNMIEQDIQGVGNAWSGRYYFRISRTLATDLASIKSWMTTNKPILTMVLATPTNTEITYTPLIEQLESIKNAMSKEGTTNVNQVNNDAPFILDLSVFNDTYNGRYQSLLEMYKRLKEAE